jgi:hypothetical protein
MEIIPQNKTNETGPEQAAERLDKMLEARKDINDIIKLIEDTINKCETPGVSFNALKPLSEKENGSDSKYFQDLATSLDGVLTRHGNEHPALLDLIKNIANSLDKENSDFDSATALTYIGKLKDEMYGMDVAARILGKADIQKTEL